ncbi:ABC-F family ATP-binding cassette domain-containing protein [Methylobacterium haplocladii]|uniref:ATP-binding protein Uup n=1 Tax=Methylobacterium haplocladii TaxID=1176176 RepID=A0A512IKN3_9HYPH|nr:ATP-binding cassette domain-containing protein [Methylobacterium haplocladii]GEO98202.1 ATP-binding protein [Methylobacterium haplocladii]GJD84403.1 ABC transporter ATP-binding protein uup [Methylobacterium haplocladii]GLS58638.1 ATP-binding protein [Methylobacterium haplocladii]
MAAPPLLTLKDVALTFGGTPLIESAELAISPGERACLVGRNGSGKSTLMKIAAGLVEPDRGERFLQPGTTLRYLAQEPDLSGFDTVLAFVEAGLAPGDDPYRARYLVESLGLTGEEDPSQLSGGEARRAALAQALAPEPDILLLDEPTNHLDLPVIEWLEGELGRTRAALVLISHDRRFLSGLTRATVWLDRGVTRRIDQGFSAFEAWRDAFFEEEERDRHKLERKIADEEHWLRYGVTARRKRNVRRLGNLHSLRKERRDERRPVGTATMTSMEAEASGTLVVEAKGISKGYGERTIVDNLSIRVTRGDRLGIVGANGAGKTTLVNLLTGKLAPDSGVARLGTNLSMMLLDQARAVLEPTMTVTDVLTGGRGDSIMVGGRSRHVIGYLKDFLFAPEQARTPVSVLSGGERNRLLIARALAQPSNLLVLDEPTNDLDLETLDLLQEMLDDYAGTLILVSHDRDFLDRVVGSVLVSEGEGRWTEYAGGYSDMLTQRGKGVDARTVATRGGARERTEPRGEPAGESSRKKMGFKEQHELKTLPVRMRELETGIARLKTVLDDPDLYASDFARFEKASSMLSAAQTELSAAEDRWLALELLRESQAS